MICSAGWGWNGAARTEAGRVGGDGGEDESAEGSLEGAGGGGAGAESLERGKEVEGVGRNVGVWEEGGRVLRRLRGWKGLVADVRMLTMYLAFVSPATPQRLSSSSLCSGPAFSPVATTAWRRLPPPSRMVLLLAGLGPGSRPPLPPVSELLLRVSSGGLPVTGREGLLHIQGYSSWDPTGNLNLGL